MDVNDIIPPGAKIKVIGVGGGGGNAVNTMIRSNIEGVDFISCNTDIQALQFSLADTKIQIGKELTRGLGAGADPDVGRDAALEDRHAIQEALEGANMVFVTAGMGGGTGTGGASIVAQVAKDLGALTVAVVTKPFGFEGKRRRRQADLGIARLKEQVDTLISIPNQRLLQVSSGDLSMIDAFRMAEKTNFNQDPTIPSLDDGDRDLQAQAEQNGVEVVLDKIDTDPAPITEQAQEKTDNSLSEQSQSHS